MPPAPPDSRVLSGHGDTGPVTARLVLPPRSRKLIAPGSRATAVTAAVLASAVLIALAVWLHGTSAATAPDAGVDRWAQSTFTGASQQVLLSLTTPGLVIGLPALLALGAALVARWDVVALLVLAPALAAGLSSEVLKPLVQRQHGYFTGRGQYVSVAPLGFPSGHETALVAALSVLIIALLRLRPSRGVLTGALGVAAIWAGLGAVGLISADYHFLTDTIGGACVGIAVAVAGALTIDAGYARFAPVPVPALR